MAFLGSLGRAVRKVLPFVSPVGGLMARGYEKKRQGEREVMRQYEQQQGAIRQQAQALETERARIASARERSEQRLRAGSIRANRRRVRGGLFGDASVDQNVSPRLG